MYRHSGSGSRSINRLFSGVGARGASHLLHSLAGFIYDSPLEVAKSSKRRGDVEVSDTPLVHHLDPRREDDMIKGYVGGSVEGLVKVSFHSLEEDRGFPIKFTHNPASERQFLRALTLNIEHNILEAQPKTYLESDFNLISDLISVPHPYEIKGREIDEDSVSFRVEGLSVRGASFVFKVILEAEFFIYAEKSRAR